MTRHIRPDEVSGVHDIPVPIDPDEKYIAEALIELTFNPRMSIGRVSHLIPKVHFREISEEHCRERERVRSLLRRKLPARLISTKRPSTD